MTLPCAPTESFYSNSLAQKYQYDPLKFVSFLNGYNIPRKDGKTKEMKLLVNSDDSARTRIARNIASALTELGLPTTTVEYGGVTYQNVMKNANYDIYLGMTRLSANMDLTFGHYNVYAQRGLIPDLNPSRDNVFYYSLGRTMEGIELAAAAEEE